MYVLPHVKNMSEDNDKRNPCTEGIKVDVRMCVRGEEKSRKRERWPYLQSTGKRPRRRGGHTARGIYTPKWPLRCSASRCRKWQRFREASRWAENKEHVCRPGERQRSVMGWGSSLVIFHLQRKQGHRRIISNVGIHISQMYKLSAGAPKHILQHSSTTIIALFQHKTWNRRTIRTFSPLHAPGGSPFR